MDSHSYTKFIGNEVLQNNDLGEEFNAKVLLAFHGFGQSASVYKMLIELYPDIIIYSFDLFAHGESKWDTTNYNYSPEAFKQELHQLFEKEQIQCFDVIAFSIGCRLALATAAFFPERVNKLCLVAPDGIYENVWYHFATKNWLGNYLFRQFTKHEKWLYTTTKIFNKYRIVDEKLLKVAEKVVHFYSLKKVYTTWMLYRHFTFGTRKVFSDLFDANKHVWLVTSNNDEVILENKLRLKLEKLGVLSKIKVISFVVYHQRLLRHSLNSSELGSFFTENDC
ncbi:alpha/beta fold hydrolase [Chondrinema litorale]|uniref:alpha/beta fold hydrolase n=1 Tax=Chondrinema litorale TaxID=2994555 RepID=UPI0025435D13|nr:alpha/beta hydrolase [Chondrinema litorale]UZR95670.1 alpha/beta hydrolase [Chondrinema litorale]